MFEVLIFLFFINLLTKILFEYPKILSGLYKPLKLIKLLIFVFHLLFVYLIIFKKVIYASGYKNLDKFCFFVI